MSHPGPEDMKDHAFDTMLPPSTRQEEEEEEEEDVEEEDEKVELIFVLK